MSRARQRIVLNGRAGRGWSQCDRMDEGLTLGATRATRYGMIASASRARRCRSGGGKFDHLISVKEPTFAMLA